MFILYITRTICSEIDGLRIQVVFLESVHIIQVSLCTQAHRMYNIKMKTPIHTHTYIHTHIHTYTHTHTYTQIYTYTRMYEKMRRYNHSTYTKGISKNKYAMHSHTNTCIG